MQIEHWEENINDSSFTEEDANAIFEMGVLDDVLSSDMKKEKYSTVLEYFVKQKEYAKNKWYNFSLDEKKVWIIKYFKLKPCHN